MWIVLSVLLMGSCTRKESSAEAVQYTCPMHPTVISNKQGTCPVCGMELVRKGRTGEEVKITEDIAKLLKSPDESVVADVETIRGEFKSMPVTIDVQGVVTYDTRMLYTISARVAGRLEHVVLRYPLQQVRKGQIVAEIYSPELLTAQRELLFLIENDAGNTDLLASAKSKLALLGATTEQIEQLIQKRETNAKFQIFSSRDGYLIGSESTMQSGNADAGTATEAGGSSMENSGMKPVVRTAAATTVPEKALIREGDYVSRGQTLFTLASKNAVRLEFSIPSIQSGAMRKGDPLMIRLGADQKVNGLVDFVQPFFDEGSEYQKVRVYIRDADLQIGQLVNASLHRESAEALWIPTEAVVDVGTEKIVFVKERGAFKPKSVTTGIRSGKCIEIKLGISSSDEIAARANYLIDSESFIKSK